MAAIDTGAPIRGEQWVLTWAPEATAGTDPGTALLVNVFGVHQQASLPDPKNEINDFWMLGNESYRNYYVAYRGKRIIQGSVPDSLLLNGCTLYLPIGKKTTTGTDSGAGGSTLNGDVAVGATSVILTSGSGYATGDYIQIGTSTNPECRQISNVATNTLTLTQPLDFAHLSGVTCNEVAAPFTHTITETFQLPTITMHASMYSADQTLQLVRRYLGGRVGRSTITAREGEYLTQSFDDLSFMNLKVWGPNMDGNVPYYDGTISSDVTAYFPCSQPYLFSYGSLSLNGSTFARVRAFSLDIANNLQPKYYIQNSVDNPQLPYEYREGQRKYTIRVDIDVVDDKLYKELLKQGVYSDVYTGFQTILEFKREGSATDTIKITSPPSTPGCGGNAQGCLIRSGNYDISSQEPIVHTPIDIIARSVTMEVIDSVANLPEAQL